MIIYTAYFTLSLMFAIVAIIVLVAIVHFSRTGKTILGVKLHPNSIEARRLKKISTSKISVVGVVGAVLLFAVNLIYSTIVIFNLSASIGWTILIAGVLFLAGVWGGVFYVNRSQIITKDKQ